MYLYVRLTSRLIYCDRTEDMVLINFVLLFIVYGVFIGAYGERGKERYDERDGLISQRILFK